MKNISKKYSIITARTHNLFHKYPTENIFYLHIPKCGGTSLNNALQNFFLRWSFSDTSSIVNLDGPSSWGAIEKSKDSFLSSDTVNDYAVMKFREELLLYHMSQQHISFISGHFPFSTATYKSFSDKYAFITLLRNPVDRWISSYFYNRNRQKYGYRKIEMSLEDYINSSYGISQGCEYSKFLAGIDSAGDYMTESSVNQAKDNLHKFRLVGFLENIESFEEKFQEIFGRRLSVGFLNQKTKSEKSNIEKILADFRHKIEEICEPDMEVYNYAIKSFG